MTDPVTRFVTCTHPGGLHRLAYHEWGDPANPKVVLCVHGLTRNGRDFDVLAEKLGSRYRVICPDMIGRGRSDWMKDPMLYTVPQYVADCVTLVARLGVETVDWIGTSMGGLIGMTLAGMPGNPIARLVLNDIGPVLDMAGLNRIRGYVGGGGTFESFEAGERILRQVMTEFGPHTDEQFRYLSRHYLVQRDGLWTFHYDPLIASAFKAGLEQGPPPELWFLYDQIKVPTLVTRGQRSDLLAAATAQAMTQRGPRATLVEIAGVGHAPTYIAQDQVAIIERFLN